MAAGTIRVTNGSKAVVGTGTAFTSFTPGSFLTFVLTGVAYTVAIDTIESNTNLTLAVPFDGATTSGVSFDITAVASMALATMGVTVQAQKALRMMIADATNWRQVFGSNQTITVTLPDGSQFTGYSWGYISELLKDIDIPTLSGIRDDTIAAKNQAQTYATNSANSATAAASANTAAQSAKTAAAASQQAAAASQTAAAGSATAAAGSATTAGNQATTATQQAALAKQYADSVNPANLLNKNNNLSDVANADTAKNNLGLEFLIQNSTWAQMYAPAADGTLGRGDWGITVSSDGSWGTRNKQDGSWKPLALSNGGTGSNTAAGARTNLGLGSAATVNTGNSGATIPLMSTNNVWSGQQTFDYGQTFFSTQGSGGIDIGSLSTVGASYVDLHSSGTGSDYDVRIRSDGGDSTAGNGSLTITARGGINLSTALGLASGGTGANNAATARDNLGVGSGNAVQFRSLVVQPTASTDLPLIDLRPYGSSGTYPKVSICGIGDGTCQVHTYDASNTRKRYFFADQIRNGTANVDRTIVTNGDFGLGAGTGGYQTPENHGTENAFISGGGGGLTWCPSGAGFQSSYGDNRTGQMIIQPNGVVSFRWVKASAETAISTTAYTILQNSGTSDINFKHVNGDLDVDVSLANIDAMSFKLFYYLDDEDQTERRGIIAQDIELIDPEYVHGAEQTGKMTIDLNPLVMDGLAAIQALSRKVKALETELAELKAA